MEEEKLPCSAVQIGLEVSGGIHFPPITPSQIITCLKEIIIALTIPATLTTALPFPRFVSCHLSFSPYVLFKQGADAGSKTRLILNSQLLKNYVHRQVGAVEATISPYYSTCFRMKYLKATGIVGNMKNWSTLAWLVHIRDEPEQSGEHQPSSSKKCKFLSSVLKDPFSNCHNCRRRRLSYSSSEEDETPISDFEDLQEMIISVIRSRAMESKVQRKRSMTETYSSVLHPTSGELFLGSIKKPEEIEEEGEEEKDEFTSARSHLSLCSFTSLNTEGFHTVRTNLSCCPSLKDPDLAENKWWSSEVLDTRELRRRAIIQEICHCKGWPFGLCRKALLLPPLPKSPSESWSWYKASPKVVKTH